MTSKEHISEFIDQLEKFESKYKQSRKKDDSADLLVNLQKGSRRVSEILKKLNIVTIVGIKSAGVSFDLFDVSLNPITWEEREFGSQRLENIGMLLQQLRSAEGYLEGIDKLESDIILNQHIDEEVRQRYLEGDFGSAVTKAFKIFKDELFKKTGTEDVNQAIGKLKLKWESNLKERNDIKKDFTTGIFQLFQSMSNFRNADFHSRNWSVSDQRQAIYFINTLSMALDFLENYLQEKS